ncbi:MULTISPECIES: glycosyltransferase [Pseudonocardia]|uniref:4'-demethylrebeccamycin synthase n=2 Tax=Pseudonocardia TaxID=1847 RepID=A0A1Y2N1Y1_PSEAH|nr:MULTISPECIES: nucleotide disphospho-sugar-binding domain-containing protein [Pseudonocardia]OSY41450.1 4'-demethylrebeccamycin synthase [Pseudonocardia autotrophica]TDN71407.1 UDP-glucoronosyl/UDP-glucosyl transferase [Pseudonocardia autotrophica]BBG02082.1 oleandomycin glycosyltransferase [Pseudonocardia autotrophica]GEC24096.1 oleandomycin glycosyltransferase [Pseudonocardia saturnea]
MTDYLFALTDGGGTVPPELGVAHRLVTRGHRVRVLADASMAADVAAIDAEFLPWAPGRDDPAPASAYRDWELRSPWALAGGMAEHMIAGPAAGHTHRLLEVVRTGAPDLGLAPVPGVWDQVHRARRQLVLTARTFDFPARLAPSVRYVGPVLDDPSWAHGERWEPPAGDGPLVLVAMSSTYQAQYATVRNVVDALTRSGARGLVTVGPALDPGLVRGGDGIVVVRSAPHAEVLDHVELVITHGGHGTVLKSLVAGRPMLVLPHGRDQRDNAARVTFRGAGEMLRRSATADRIAAAANRVLHTPYYTAAARWFGGRIRAELARSTLLAELEQRPA